MKVVNRKTRTAMLYEFVKKLSPNTYTASENMAFPTLGVPEQKCTVLYLFDNKIAASPNGSNRLYINNAGYKTNTTQGRLNALGAGIYRRAGIWYWKNGEQFPSNQWVETLMPLTLE